MTDEEIAGYMGWRGPGAYTQAKLNKIRQIVAEAERREREACAKECDVGEDISPNDVIGGEDGYYLCRTLTAAIRSRGEK